MPQFKLHVRSFRASLIWLFACARTIDRRRHAERSSPEVLRAQASLVGGSHAEPRDGTYGCSGGHGLIAASVSLILAGYNTWNGRNQDKRVALLEERRAELENLAAAERARLDYEYDAR